MKRGFETRGGQCEPSNASHTRGTAPAATWREQQPQRHANMAGSASGPVMFSMPATKPGPCFPDAVGSAAAAAAEARTRGVVLRRRTRAPMSKFVAAGAAARMSCHRGKNRRAGNQGADKPALRATCLPWVRHRNQRRETAWSQNWHTARALRGLLRLLLLFLLPFLLLLLLLRLLPVLLPLLLLLPHLLPTYKPPLPPLPLPLLHHHRTALAPAETRWRKESCW